MTADRIRNYLDDINEIRYLNKKINETQSSGKQTSVVRGSDTSYPYRNHPVNVSGLDKPTAAKLAALKQRRDNLRREVAEVQRFVESIPDRHVRRIVELRFITPRPMIVDKGYRQNTWVEIARKLGGNNTADGVRKACTRFLEKL